MKRISNAGKIKSPFAPRKYVRSRRERRRFAEVILPALLSERRGYTLIELLVVMSVAATLLLLTVGWMHQTLTFASVLKQRQRNHVNSTRLAWSLRDDVRESEAISMNNATQLVLRRTDGRQSTYTISANKVVVEKRGRASTTHRETFALSPSSTISWDTSEMPDWISLIVTRGREGSRSKASENAEPPIKSGAKPADLHIRVGPNRWPFQLEDIEVAQTAAEQAK